MTDTYTIKPLEWQQISSDLHRANNPIGQYLIGDTNKGFWFYEKYYQALDEAKAAAEAHYREQLERCLEKV